jgi:hypothetical protein
MRTSCHIHIRGDVSEQDFFSSAATLGQAICIPTNAAYSIGNSKIDGD